jgi:hypothetical protein
MLILGNDNLRIKFKLKNRMAGVGDSAKILASKILRTNIHHRPFPTLFYFPGLNSKPFHNP